MLLSCVMKLLEIFNSLLMIIKSGRIISTKLKRSSHLFSKGGVLIAVFFGRRGCLTDGDGMNTQ
jgi:hypothetical protein